MRATRDSAASTALVAYSLTSSFLTCLTRLVQHVSSGSTSTSISISRELTLEQEGLDLDLTGELGGHRSTALLAVKQIISVLTSLDLTSNMLTASCVATIVEALDGNTTLSTLVLDTNEMGDQGAAALAAGVLGCVVLGRSNCTRLFVPARPLTRLLAPPRPSLTLLSLPHVAFATPPRPSSPLFVLPLPSSRRPCHNASTLLAHDAPQLRGPCRALDLQLLHRSDGRRRDRAHARAQHDSHVAPNLVQSDR